MPAKNPRIEKAGTGVVRFRANTVVVDDSDEHFILVGFADEQDGGARESLHFQCAHQFDEQDRKLGMDSVYAQRNDQSQGGYGGVERVELHPDRVRVLIGEKLARDIGDKEFEIHISLSPDEFERLRDGLRTMFTGFETLIEHSA